jgi:hypothetical protein
VKRHRGCGVPARGRVGRALLAVPVLAVVLALVLTSSVVLHGTVLVAIALLTGLAAWLAYGLRDAGRAASVEAAWQAAAGVFVISIMTACLVVVAGGAAAAVFVLVVATAAGAAWLRWYLRMLLLVRRERSTGPDDEQDPGGTSSAPLPRFSVPVSLLPSPALSREWRRTKAVLGSASGPGAWDEVVRRRQEVLDEVERRDPNGFARWLAAGAPAGGGPGTFLYG